MQIYIRFRIKMLKYQWLVLFVNDNCIHLNKILVKCIKYDILSLSPYKMTLVWTLYFNNLYFNKIEELFSWVNHWTYLNIFFSFFEKKFSTVFPSNFKFNIIRQVFKFLYYTKFVNFEFNLSMLRNLIFLKIMINH